MNKNNIKSDQILSNLKNELDIKLDKIKANDRLKQRIIASAYYKETNKKPFSKAFTKIFGGLGLILTSLIIVLIINNNSNSKPESTLNNAKNHPQLFNAISAGKNDKSSKESSDDVSQLVITEYDNDTYYPVWNINDKSFDYITYNGINYRLLSYMQDNIDKKTIFEINSEQVKNYCNDLNDFDSTTKYYKNKTNDMILYAKVNDGFYCFQKYSMDALDSHLLNQEIINQVDSVYYSKYGLIKDKSKAQDFIKFLFNKSVASNINNSSKVNKYIIVNLENGISLQIDAIGNICIANGTFEIENIDDNFLKYKN